MKSGRSAFTVENMLTQDGGHKPDLNWSQIERELGRNLLKISVKLICGHCLVFLPRTPAPTASQIS